MDEETVQTHTRTCGADIGDVWLSGTRPGMVRSRPGAKNYRDSGNAIATQPPPETSTDPIIPLRC